MKVNGLTEEQILEVINKVAVNHRGKSFDIHDGDDIEQEVRIICLTILDKFDTNKIKNKNHLSKALEHFLNTSVSNRLKNFYRDKNIVPQKSFKSDKDDLDRQIRINLKNPLNIEEVLVKIINDPCKKLENKEHIYYIVSKLDDECQDILECILSGDKVNTYFKDRLWTKIQNLKEEIDLD